MNKINILVLDDTNDQRREVVANLIPTELLIDSKLRYDLVKSVFNVIEFSRPTQAEGYLKDAQNIKPDLIISDIRFEFADSPADHGETRGVEFIRFVATHFPAIPTIAVTFYGIDRILRQFRRELPHLSLENIYAVAREDNEFQIEDIDNIAFGLPFLLKKIATTKLAKNTLNVAEKIELLKAIEANDFLSKSISLRTEVFEIQHLMLGWAKIEKSENQSLKLVFDENANDTLREYLDDISFDFIGRMKTEMVEKLMEDYLRHTNHNNWVTEIQQSVQTMLQPFFDPTWKNIGHFNNQLENTEANIHQQVANFLNVGNVIQLTNQIDIEGGDYLDLNKAINDINNPNTIERIKNLLKARLIVLTIMHRRPIFFAQIPNVADLAILVAVHQDRLSRDFLNALYYIKIGNRPAVGNIPAINANTRSDAMVKAYFQTFLCIRGTLTILQSNQARMTYDTFNAKKLLPEEQAWLKHIDEKGIFI